MKKTKIIRTIIIILIILTLAVIWGHSFMSKAQSSEESGYVKELLDNLINPNGIMEISEFLIRKCAHFIEYAILGAEFISLLILGGLAPKGDKKFNLYFKSAIPALFVALTDETIQYFSGRASRVLDVWLDFAGASFAILLGMFLLSRGCVLCHKRKVH